MSCIRKRFGRQWILFYTCAWRFGSNRSKQPTCCPCVCIMPAHTMLSGFGSMPSNNWTPNPSSLFFAEAKSSGVCALNTFCARCWSLKKIRYGFLWNCTRNNCNKIILPSQIFPSSKEWFAIHFSRLEKFVYSQWQLDIKFLLDAIIFEWYIKWWSIWWKYLNKK